MSSSDIYGSQDLSGARQKDQPPVSQFRRRSSKTFDEAVGHDLSGTHRRRNRNTGFRRFQHLMKKPAFNKKFWMISLSVAGLLLASLLLWDLFLRYRSE